MVGLKYTGKKIPFVYENENLGCKKMTWSKRGDVFEGVPIDDAEFMVLNSPSDFEIIRKEEESPVLEIEKEEEEENTFAVDLSCPHDGCDFVAKAPHGLQMHIQRKHPKPITPFIEPKDE